MKLSVILCSALLISSFAHAQSREERKGLKVYSSSISGQMRNAEVKEKLKEVQSCEQGYRLTRKRIDNNQPSGEFMLGSAMGVYAIGYMAAGLTVGYLVYPVGFAYSITQEIRSFGYKNAEKVFIASRFCDERVCNYRPLVNLRKWLGKRGIETTNEKIASIVNSDLNSLELCTEEVNKKGIRQMKTYKSLRKAILEKYKGNSIIEDDGADDFEDSDLED